MQFITWVMSEPARLFLNRKYKPVIANSSEAIMAMSNDEPIYKPNAAYLLVVWAAPSTNSSSVNPKH